MDEKKAFVFDTNFIIQHGQLDKVVENLRDHFSVYVTQVSIDERKAQQCRELKRRFDEVKRIVSKNSDIISFVRFRTSYEEREKRIVTRIQNNYEKLFEDRIIPFSNSSDTFSSVLSRSYKKKPPFASDENASDKGFKDTLIWLSIMQYFQMNGEQEVIFVTDDAGFTKNREVLLSEFRDQTGKDIEIKANSYYAELLKPELVDEPPKLPLLPDPQQLRERIVSVVYDVCYIPDADPYSQTSWLRTFTLEQRVDADDIRKSFPLLEEQYITHYLQMEIPAKTLFSFDGKISKEHYPIPIVAVDKLLQLYKEVTETYPNLLEQFFTAVATELNQNYVEPRPASPVGILGIDDDAELPF